MTAPSRAGSKERYRSVGVMRTIRFVRGVEPKSFKEMMGSGRPKKNEDDSVGTSRIEKV